MADWQPTTAAEYHRLHYADEPKCGSRGPHSATCVRPPGHPPPCEGNGFDVWGPKPSAWVEAVEPRRTTP